MSSAPRPPADAEGASSVLASKVDHGHWRLLGDSESVFLQAYHLGPRGEANLKIAAVLSVQIPARGELKACRRPALSFEGKTKIMLLNVTNSKTLASLFGSDVRPWPRNWITVYATTTRVKSSALVDCLRIRPTAPRAPEEPSK